MKTLNFEDYELNAQNFNQINFKIVKELLILKEKDSIKIVFKDGEIVLEKVKGSYSV